MNSVNTHSKYRRDVHTILAAGCVAAQQTHRCAASKSICMSFVLDWTHEECLKTFIIHIIEDDPDVRKH